MQALRGRAPDDFSQGSALVLEAFLLAYCVGSSLLPVLSAPRPPAACWSTGEPAHRAAIPAGTFVRSLVERPGPRRFSWLRAPWANRDGLRNEPHLVLPVTRPATPALHGRTDESAATRTAPCSSASAAARRPAARPQEAPGFGRVLIRGDGLLPLPRASARASWPPSSAGALAVPAVHVLRRRLRGGHDRPSFRRALAPRGHRRGARGSSWACSAWTAECSCTPAVPQGQRVVRLRRGVRRHTPVLPWWGSRWAGDVAVPRSGRLNQMRAHQPRRHRGRAVIRWRSLG
ncbi:hypothetical protein QJS66_06700 [Kocuria rhizophila]|nr:hypothetical protein QJS66_06700 [Kocuria rhizophila]